MRHDDMHVHCVLHHDLFRYGVCCMMSLYPIPNSYEVLIGWPTCISQAISVMCHVGLYIINVMVY